MVKTGTSTLLVVTAFFLLINEGLSSSYDQDVDKFFSTNFPGVNYCKSVALSKGNKVNKTTSRAIAMVNLYTQECSKYKSSKGNAFYRALNAQLRQANGTLDRGDIWGDATYLLSKALYLLPKNTVNDLYRGCACPVPKPGDTFSFTSFASASTSASAASRFVASDVGTFFSMEAMSGNGVAVANYSIFPGEREVLLDKLFHFNVTKVVKGTNQAFKQVKKIYPNAYKKPAAFVELRPLSGMLDSSTDDVVMCRCRAIDSGSSSIFRIDSILVSFMACLRLIYYYM